jgi:O-antigen/teichoic acid export membrane protein
MKISPALLVEARGALHVLAFSVPIILVSSSFSGVLEAAQRFDLVNAVKIPSSVLTFILPLVGLAVNLTLPGIVALIVAARMLALIAFVVLDFHFVPQIREYSGSFSLFARLLTFGGWVTISNIIGPILQYLNRFLIGALLAMSAVAYYTAPFDIVSRLWIIPISLVMTIFPAFSTLGLSRIEELRFFFIRATKYTFLIMGLITSFFMIFAYGILRVWLGIEFAQNSMVILQILSVGVLIGSLTHLSLALFQGIGRPDITAKIQLFLLPLSILLSIGLISKIGVIGAALSWTICRTIGMLLSWKVAWKIIHLDGKILSRNRILRELVWFAAFICTLLPLLILNSILIKFLCVLVIYFVFIFIAWHHILDARDRTLVVTFFSDFVSSMHLGIWVSNRRASKKS